MSNNKQSSVEWYSSEIGKITALALNGKMTGLEWKYLQAKAFEQAKAMHKEESQKIFECGRNFQLTGEGTFKQVYNEQFNQQKKQ